VKNGRNFPGAHRSETLRNNFEKKMKNMMKWKVSTSKTLLKNVDADKINRSIRT
jgi:hypothetical protein